jgi:hypothetical protein
MRRRAARGNRIGLSLLGLPLLLAGVAVLTRSAGLYGGSAGAPIYPAAAQRYIHGHGWIWPAVAAAAIVIGLVCLRWLLVQGRRDLVRHIRLDSHREAHPGAGRTILPADAVTDFVSDELADQPGVRRVTAFLGDRSERPELWVRLTAAADIDPVRLREHLAGDLLPSLRDALGRPDLAAYVRLHLTRRAEHDRQGVLIGEVPTQARASSARADSARADSARARSAGGG